MNKLTLCITCCNRLWQIKETLPVNLSLYEKYENVEFVLANINSKDGLDDYVKSNKQILGLIEKDRFIYIHDTRSNYYSSPKAKNIAHRMARNNILFNLDGDQYADNLVDFILKYQWEESMLLHLNNKPTQPGSWGRIVIQKNLFYKLGGYDESFYPMGFQDCDLMNRAVAYGAKRKNHRINQKYISIINSKEEKTVNTGCDIPWEKMRELNIVTSENNIKNKNLVVNQKGWGECFLKVNFKEEQYFAPIIP